MHPSSSYDKKSGNTSFSCFYFASAPTSYSRFYFDFCFEYIMCKSSAQPLRQQRNETDNQTIIRTSISPQELPGCSSTGPRLGAESAPFSSSSPCSSSYLCATKRTNLPQEKQEAVSYTHLTLPTIYSV